MFSKLLGWRVLRTRADTSMEIEILVLATSRPCSNDAGHTGG
jgi:hypothetical protein